MSERQGICCAALGVLLSLALLVPVSEAQFKATDNFNRPDGAVGLGWVNWGNGAQISGNQLATFGELSVGGGIYRILDATFPLVFSFDFSTTDPAHGGWQIIFNAATPDGSGNAVNFTGEFGFYESTGADPVCIEFQTSSGPIMQCGNVVKGQREFSASQAVITGTVNSDLSGTVKIKYNDGQKPATVTVKTPAPAGVIQSPQGSIMLFGNTAETSGPHTFDNFSLTLN
jgi:hypothetical protein